MNKIACALLAAVLAAASSCGSDAEGPVVERFVDDGTYGLKAGESRLVSIPVNVVTVDVPQSTGSMPLNILGRLRGVEYRAVLIAFDFTRSAADSARTVRRATLRLPVLAASPENVALRVTFNELDAGFDESDTITAVPAYRPEPVPDSLGGTVREIGIGSIEFDLDADVVNGWLSGARPFHGLAIVWAETPDTSSTVEFNARQRGTDPPAVKIAYADGTSGSFGATDDYTVAAFPHGGLDVVGGIARRLYFTFDPSVIPGRATIHASFLVLRTRGDLGLGETAGDLALGLTYMFAHYLYAPNSSDTLSADWRKGTGVDEDAFDPRESATLKLPLRGYLADVLSGARANDGLVLQSNLEVGRIQRAAFAGSGEYAPRIDVLYTMPADVGRTP